MARPDEHRLKTYAGDMMADGREGEKQVLSLLRSLPAVKRILDCRHSPEWQAKDVDFVVLVGSQRVAIEAKSDVNMGITGNVLFEDHRHYLDTNQTRLGWSWFSEADYFMVWSPQIRTIYSMKAGDFRQAMQAILKANPLLKPREVATDKTTRTYIYLLSESLITFKRFQLIGNTWMLKKD